MLARAGQLLLAMVLPALWGAWRGDWRLVAVGMLAGAAAWLVWDCVQRKRLLRWLPQVLEQSEPRVDRFWGDVARQVRRLSRQLQRERQEAIEQLAEFKAAIQNSPNAVVLLDESGRIEWSNLTARDLLGILPERDRQQHVTNLLRHPAFTHYLQGGEWNKEVLIEAASASLSQPRMLAVRVHPYGQGRRLLLARDVTATQQAETMRRDFVANVSHEIRTPLTVLSGFVETLQTLDLDEPQRQQYLELMAQQAQRMQSLVSDLLTLSRLEGGPLPGRQTKLEVAPWLLERVGEARALSAALGGGHALRADAPQGVFLSGNPEELTSAVTNLLANAIRHTPAGSSVRVEASVQADGSLVVAVSDTGPGIAPEHLPRLTERFYRVDRSRSRDTGGTGLGLAIVKHVVQRHGGQLMVSSQLGKGSTFSLRFPPDRVTVKQPVAQPAS